MPATTWNSADNNGNTLSNGDLTATGTFGGTWSGVRATTGKTSGKWYWEVTVTGGAGAISQHLVGFSKEATDLQLGLVAQSYGYHGCNGCGTDGGKYSANVLLAYGTGYVTAVIGNALDLDGGNAWWSLDDVWQASGDPAAGTNPAYTGITLGGTVYYPHYSSYQIGMVAVANFGATAFAGTKPSGFSGIDGQSGPANLKTYMGVAVANIAKINGVSISSIKKLNNVA